MGQLRPTGHIFDTLALKDCPLKLNPSGKWEALSPGISRDLLPLEVNCELVWQNEYGAEIKLASKSWFISLWLTAFPKLWLGPRNRGVCQLSPVTALLRLRSVTWSPPVVASLPPSSHICFMSDKLSCLNRGETAAASPCGTHVNLWLLLNSPQGRKERNVSQLTPVGVSVS